MVGELSSASPIIRVFRPQWTLRSHTTLTGRTPPARASVCALAILLEVKTDETNRLVFQEKARNLGLR